MLKSFPASCQPRSLNREVIRMLDTAYAQHNSRRTRGVTKRRSVTPGRRNALADILADIDTTALERLQSISSDSITNMEGRRGSIPTIVRRNSAQLTNANIAGVVEQLPIEGPDILCSPRYRNRRNAIFNAEDMGRPMQHYCQRTNATDIQLEHEQP